jgi:hypothetical protein
LKDWYTRSRRQGTQHTDEGFREPHIGIKAVIDPREKGSHSVPEEKTINARRDE